MGETGIETVFLHIGMMKTGTTYLQSRLREHREELAADGVMVPGHQLSAIRDRFGRHGPIDRRSAQGAWDGLLMSLRNSSLPRAVISMEFLSRAKPEELQGIVAELAPADVRVVVTVRDIARVLAAQWQETLQNRAIWTWEEYSRDVGNHISFGVSPSPRRREPGRADSTELDPAQQAEDEGDATPPEGSASDSSRTRGRGSAGPTFWDQHDVARVVREWEAVVTAANVHIVTVPAAGSPADLLWRRFAGVIGVPPDRCQPQDGPIRANSGLDLGAAEFLRLLNIRLDGEIHKATYIRNVKHVLGKRALQSRGNARKPQLTPALHAQMTAYSHWLTDRLRSLDVHIVGDLADLLPAPLPDDAPTIPGELDREVADAAIDAVVAIVRHIDAAGTRVDNDIEHNPPGAAGGESGNRSKPERAALAPARRRAKRRESRRGRSAPPASFEVEPIIRTATTSGPVHPERRVDGVDGLR